MRRGILVVAALAALLGACGGDDGGAGSGVLQITTYGEDFIEQEIPAAEFADGWRCVFGRFLIALGPIEIAEHGGTVGGDEPRQQVFDMTGSGPHPVTQFEGIGARRWDEVSVVVGPVGAGAVAGNAAPDDVTLLQGSGYSVFVEGTLDKGGVTKTFAWGFTTDTEYQECQKAVEEGGELGVSVPDGGVATAQVTIHGDHFFYDNLASADAVLRGQAIADADTDGDGAVTLAELDAVDLATLPLDQYGTGGAPGVNTLGDFIVALTRTLVHYQGEGHCHAHAR